jgi:hypothetical protein
MGSGGSCHECKRYHCICNEKDSIKEVIEKIILIVQAEEELEGEMPDHLFYTSIKDKESMTSILRDTVRLTKQSIVTKLTKLTNKL